MDIEHANAEIYFDVPGFQNHRINNRASDFPEVTQETWKVWGSPQNY
jgi:hypothetical protein